MRGYFLTFGCLAIGSTAVAQTLLAEAETVSATTYVIIASLFAMSALIAALPQLIQHAQAARIEIRSMVAIVTMGAMGLYSTDFSKDFAFVAAADTVQMPAQVETASSSTLPRHKDGHFRAVAAVNGNHIPFLVDTGASVVLFTYEYAQTAGLDMDALTFDLPILTANGRGYVAEVIIPEIRIGDVSVNNIRAAVAESGQLHANLLGMSFIGSINEAVIRKDQMILRN